MNSVLTGVFPWPPSADLVAEWRALWLEGAHEPSASPDWIQSLVEAYGIPHSECFIVTVSRDGRLCAVVPMECRTERILGLTVRTIALISERYQTHSDAVVRGYDVDFVRAWIGALNALPRQWEVFRIGRLLENRPLADALRLATECAAHRWRDEFASFYSVLPSSAAEYLAARSSKFRNHLRRSGRKLAAAGVIRFEVIKAPEQWARGQQDMFGIERASWKHSHGTAITRVARQERFFSRYCVEALQKGLLHLSILHVGDTPAAYNLGVVLDRRYFYLKTSYRQDLRALGVAAVCRMHLIEDLIARSIRELDFPGEPYEWESQWAADLKWHQSLLIFGSTALGRALRIAVHARGLFGGRNARQVRYFDPKQQGVIET